MAFPPPQAYNAVQDAIDAAQTIVRRSAGIDTLFEDIQQFLAAGGRAAGAAAATGGGEAEITMGEAAGDAFGSSLGLVVVLIVLLVLLAIRLSERNFVVMAGWIPLKGGAAQNVVRGWFRWVDNIENEALKWYGNQLLHTLAAFRVIVFWALGIDPDTLRAILGMTTAQKAGPVTQAQVAHLQSEINWLRQHMSTVQYITTDKGSTATVPSNVFDQLHHLEAQVSLMHQDLLNLSTRVDLALHTAQSVERQQVALARTVTAVRAVAIGWQEVEQDVSELTTTVSHFIDATTAKENDLSRVQARMLPLTLLLQPGIRGLKNLRTLEDNMCQCPKLPDVPNLMPERLALYEFMTNG